MKVLLAQINPTIGDFNGNTKKILAYIAKAKASGADIVLFPELAITGYPPEDFLLLDEFLNASDNALEMIISATEGIIAIVGVPRRDDTWLRNSAAVIEDGELLGFQDKTLLPTYDVFDERRYFEPSSETKLWHLRGKKVAVTICEDLWQHSNLVKFTTYNRDPVEELADLYPDLVLNLSASPFSISKLNKRVAVCTKAAATLGCPVLMTNQVGGNDSLVYAGYSIFSDSDGILCGLAKGFVEDAMLVDLSQKHAAVDIHDDKMSDLYHALVLGLHDYFHKSGFSRACLGLSGGIDSALVACIAADALGSDNVLGVTMPSRYSSESSIADAEALAKNLKIPFEQIPIESPFQAYLNLLQPQFKGMEEDATEENLQARIRGMIMMALSNKLGYVVLSTGNKSEMAMGYATLYGDMAGGLGVINDVTKQQVYGLSRWINKDREIIPWNTINKPPSAELRPNQKDSDTLPDYEIIDNVLQGYVEEHHSPEEIARQHGYDLNLVNDLIKRIHRNEYKRRQSPPGLRVSEKAFSVGRRFPIVQRWV
ncbi:MAG: NAD+ synthase [Chlamydiales bacterium]|nr:NAD+ synthase [Chlamydiia bacterium]MCP5507833.1 NAD+ synthase [Chlamydiales bacterium]